MVKQNRLVVAMVKSEGMGGEWEGSVCVAVGGKRGVLVVLEKVLRQYFNGEIILSTNGAKNLLFMLKSEPQPLIHTRHKN